METIELFQAIKEMRESRTPFSVEFFSCSLSRQTGGDLIKMKNVLVAGQQHNISINSMISFREADKPSGKQRRGYIWLLHKYNGKKIIW